MKWLVTSTFRQNASDLANISRNSAAGYYSTFRALLKIAYKEKMLRENLNDFLEKIEWKEVKKEYLTLRGKATRRHTLPHSCAETSIAVCLYDWTSHQRHTQIAVKRL